MKKDVKFKVSKFNDDEKFFPSKKKKKLRKILLILFIILMIFLVKSIISLFEWKKLSTEMAKNEPSQVVDTDNNVIAKFGSEKNKENVSIENIPQNLKNAYIAIEDERFYNHFGIDVKRTCSAIVHHIFRRGNGSFGASTITQQLVKNMTGDDSATISRKVREWKKAIELELWFGKDEILETYLNIIYLGPNVYGVNCGAKYYFNKNIDELNLAECAFLAGINNSPNSYNPFNQDTENSEKIKNRTDIVLNKMLELGYISQEECDNAKKDVDNGLTFNKGILEPESNGVYSYHTDALLTELTSEIAEKYDISNTFATNFLQMSGLKIYSTQNSTIQSKMESEFKMERYIIASSQNEGETSQAAMIIMDHKTGQVVGCVGGLGEKTKARGLNRATQSVRQTGSSSKPIAVIAPALAEKIITPVTTYMDEATTFIDDNGEEYSPTDYNDYIGQITVRRAVESSQNIPFVKIMEKLTPQKSVSYLKKMGITSLSKDDENLALALGGENNGISVLEMAGAYSTIANDGVYIEPTFYTKVVNSKERIIIKTKQKSRKVFSKSVSFVTKQLMLQPVEGTYGTARYCKINGIDVAAKTGTTNENYDRWLCGFTNYYTAVTWYGYDQGERIQYSGHNPAGVIWARVMKNIHANYDDSKFEMPKGVKEIEICKSSGQTATENCSSTYTEYFVNGTEPKECVMHK